MSVRVTNWRLNSPRSAGRAGTLSLLERPHGGYAQYAVFHRGLTG